MGWQQDIRISKVRHLRLLAVTASAFVLAMAVACSRQPGVLPLAQPTGAGHDLPFNQGSEDRGLSPTQAFVLSAPAGSPIIVRLISPLSSAQAQSGDSFRAVLDEPILVRGQILAKRGTPVLGRVAVAEPSRPDSHDGYLRLTLSSITTNRDTLVVQTSSIFAKGSAPELDRSYVATSGAQVPRANQLLRTSQIASTSSQDRAQTGDAEFSTAQRLTFRLLEPLSTGR
jgi:hypothetical protein